LLIDARDDVVALSSAVAYAVHGAVSATDGVVSTREFLGALGTMGQHCALALRLAPPVGRFLQNIGSEPNIDGPSDALLAPLRVDDNLSDRITAAHRLCERLEEYAKHLSDVYQDYRLRRWPAVEIDLALDRRQDAPVRIYRRVAGPEALRSTSGYERARFSALNQDPAGRWLAIAFSKGDHEVLTANMYRATVNVDGVEEDRGGTAEQPQTADLNAGFPIKTSGLSWVGTVDVELKGGGFKTAAVYRLIDDGPMRPDPVDPRPPITVFRLNKTDNRKSEPIVLREKRPWEARIELQYDRTKEHGGQGPRHPFEIAITRTNQWKFKVIVPGTPLPQAVAYRWNEKDNEKNETHDYPTLPKSLQLGLYGRGGKAQWFMTCKFAERDGRLHVLLEQVAPGWPE
jgi:hypothetical protein